MRKLICLSTYLLCLTLTGCGANTDQGGSVNPENPGTQDVPMGTDVGSYIAGLQTSGDFGFEDTTDRKERVIISAPIIPRTDVIYAADGRVPADPVAEAALGHAASLTYAQLLTGCAPLYPGIVVPAPGKDLTPAERTNNFVLIATCAYEKYYAKPYWIPKLVNDLDLCGTELGKDYRLPTEADLAALRDADYRFLSERLTTAAGTTDFFGNTYFSLLIYVRGADGTLKLGDLSAGATARVTALGVSQDSQAHYEHYPNPLSLRCIRRTPKS